MKPLRLVLFVLVVAVAPLAGQPHKELWSP